MYPSGPWIGHWDQHGLGRQPMHDLTIEFEGRRLAGKGWDCVGSFTMSGAIRSNHNVRIIKKYVDRHAVLYEGQHDGEGTIFGVWALASDNGTFALRPSGGFRNSRQEIPEFRP